MKEPILLLFEMSYDFQTVRNVAAVENLNFELLSLLQNVICDFLDLKERFDFSLELFYARFRHFGATFDQSVRCALDLGSNSVKFKLRKENVNIV